MKRKKKLGYTTGREERSSHMVDWMGQNTKEKTLENRIFDGRNHTVVFD